MSRLEPSTKRAGGRHREANRTKRASTCSGSSCDRLISKWSVIKSHNNQNRCISAGGRDTRGAPTMTATLVVAVLFARLSRRINSGCRCCRRENGAELFSDSWPTFAGPKADISFEIINALARGTKSQQPPVVVVVLVDHSEARSGRPLQLEASAGIQLLALATIGRFVFLGHQSAASQRDANEPTKATAFYSSVRRAPAAN